MLGRVGDGGSGGDLVLEEEDERVEGHGTGVGWVITPGRSRKVTVTPPSCFSSSGWNRAA